MLPRGHATSTYGKPVQRSLPTPGKNGLNGTVVHVGTGAPSTTIGATGDMYLDSGTGQWYGPKDRTVISGSTSWGGAIP